MRRLQAVVAGGVLLALSGMAGAQEWTRFRGPNGTGVAIAKGLPVQFTEKEANWKVALPGVGHSSPVLWGRKLFLTGAEAEKGRRSLLCFDADSGKMLWTQSYPFRAYHTHEFNTAASSTPAVDAERVYTLWPAPEGFVVTAHTHGGKEVWRRDLGPYPTQHGGASSPIVHDGLLIFSMEPEGGEGGLYALDVKTGETRWKRARPSDVAIYSTPILYRPPTGGLELVFTSMTHGFTSLEPKSGSLLWEVGGVFRARCVGSPVIVGNLIFATAGSGGGDRQAVAVRPEPKDGKREVAYRVNRGAPYVPTPLAYDGRLYLWGDNGVVSCVRADTGAAVWSERVGGNFFGSPICAEGKLYALSAKGELVVVATGDTFKLLGKTDLGETSHATPAVANGTLFLRTERHLLSVGGKKPQTASAERR